MVRLVSAVEALADTRDALAVATRSANEFWSAVGHIGAEDAHRADGTAARCGRRAPPGAGRRPGERLDGGDPAVLVGAAVWSWQRGSRGLAVVFALVAALPAVTLAKALPWPALVLIAVLLAVVVWNRWSRTSATVTRWGARTRRKAGVASTLDIARVASGPAVKRRAGDRPPVAGASCRGGGGGGCRRWRSRCGCAGSGCCTVWSSIEDVTLVFGGPRTGKTAVAGRAGAGRPGRGAGHLAPAPTCTSCARRCGARRGPVFVFNAVGLAGLPSTITFDPLTGCADPVTATERATDMLAATTRARRGAGIGSSGTPRPAGCWPRCCTPPRWAGGRCATCWAGWPTRSWPRGRCRRCCAGRRMPAFEQDAIQFVQTNDRTRTSITSTIMPALGWLTHPARPRPPRDPGARRSTSPSCSRRGRRCSCSARRRPRPPRWCAR